MRHTGYLLDAHSGERKYLVWYETEDNTYRTDTLFSGATIEEFSRTTSPTVYDSFVLALEQSRLGNHTELGSRWGCMFEPLVQERKGLMKFLEKHAT